MAVYRGREVRLNHALPKGYIEPIMIGIKQKDGSIDTVPLDQLSFTKSEADGLRKEANEPYTNLNIMDDKDLQALRDSQDPDKINQRINA